MGTGLPFEEWALVSKNLEEAIGVDIDSWVVDSELLLAIV